MVNITRQFLVYCFVLLVGTAIAVAQSSPPVPAASAPAPPAASGPGTVTPSAATPPTATPAQAATDRVVVKVPTGGSFLAWVEARGGVGPATTAPAAFTGAETSISLPAAPKGLQSWRVYLLDQTSGYSAVKEVATGKDAARELSFTAPDFNRVHRVRVTVTGAGGKPIASGAVSLTDAAGTVSSRVLDPSAAGVAEFTDIPSGKAQLAVTPSGSGSTTKEIAIGLTRGEAAQAVAVALPEVTQIVEGAAPATATTTTPAAGSAALSATPNAAGSTPDDSSGSQGTGTGSERDGGSPLSAIVGFLILAGAGYGVYILGRNRGWTLDKGLTRLGIQTGPETSASPATAKPMAPPPPPVDPNVCAFCGNRKDPVSGQCACSVVASPGGATGAAFNPFAVASPAGGSGPRLIATQGSYMGQIFALNGETTVGRDGTNGIPMESDTTVSRRHARLTPADGGYRIEDLGSSNGLFVNGVKVAEATLRPGDEVSIGGTRFRFEN